MSSKEIREFYWERDVFKPSKAEKAVIYKENKFGFNKEIQKLTLEYPKFQLGFLWISRIRCGFKFDSSISIKRKIVSEDCPIYCPCCGTGVQSFSHWILNCRAFSNFRENYPFLDELFLQFSLIAVDKSLDVSFDSENDYEDNINYFVLSSLLGGTSVYEKLKLNTGEQRQLVDNIFKKSTESTVPYFVCLAEFLTNVIPIICQHFKLMIELFSVEPSVAKSVDVERIRHGSPPAGRSDTESIDSTSNGATFEEWEKLEAIASSVLL